MRYFLIKLSSILLLVFAASQVAHASVLVRNKDGRTHQIAISHKIGRTSTEIPPNGMLKIARSEEATALQLEDKAGNPIGAKVAISDGDHVTLKSGAILCTPAVDGEEN